MFGRIPAFRPTLAAAALVAAAAAGLAPAAARAQSTTVNFNTLNPPAGDVSGTLPVNNCYTEAGFTFTATGVACGTARTFAAYGFDAFAVNPNLTDPALSLNMGATTIDVTRAAGGAFGFSSLQLGTFFGSTTNVTLIGTLLGGGMLSQACPQVLGSATSLLTCNLTAFTGMSFTSVRISSNNARNQPFVLIDNLVLSPSATAVPEPATVALLGIGLVAVGAAARRRRA